MLNVFMLCESDAAIAARSLAALVPAVVLGHVGRAVLRVPQANGDIRRLADEAGSDLVIGGEADALLLVERQKRPGWWLVMRTGQFPVEGWSDEAMHHIASHHLPGVILPARGWRNIAVARQALLFGRANTRHHMLIVPPEQRVDGYGDNLGWRSKNVRLRTRFEA